MMTISTDYDEISLPELKAIYNKRTNMSFSVLCSTIGGIVSMVPIANADILFSKGECTTIFDPNHTKYYILKTLKKHFQGQNEFYKMTYDQSSLGDTEAEIRGWLASKLELFSNMSTTDKESYFIDLHNALTYDNKRYNPDREYNARIVDILFDVGVLMRVIADDFVKEKPFTEAEKKEYRRLGDSYQKLVYDINTTVIRYIKQNRKSGKYMRDFMSNRLLNISFPLSHAMRVFIMYSDFLFYYNEVFNTGLARKVRRSFDAYQDSYNRVFEAFDNRKSAEKLEDVFRDSMQAMNNSLLEQCALAASVHDIGKFYDMDYYVGKQNSDGKRIQKHLFRSYYMLNRESQSLNTIYTVAFHHEYYGKGYGPFNFMYKTKKTEQPYFYSRNVISYDIHDVLNCEALAYFPAKMLEIVDVYDTILYPWFEDQSFQASTTAGVLDIMKKNYIEKDVKLDPILFDVFIGYLEGLEESDLSIYKKFSTN